MQEDFFLKSVTAQKLYREYAKDLPIFDYHCHLKPEEILKDKRFRNISEMWLEKDHYKWRLMRMNGISEYFITGKASDKEKFYMWMKTIENCIGNPMYNWCHMELHEFFRIDKTLCMDNAEYIWSKANQEIREKNITPRYILKKMNVKVIGTTDSPLSDLQSHKELCTVDNHPKIIPSMRIDILMKVNLELINNISDIFNYQIKQYDEYINFIESRIDYFDKNNCRSVDCGLGNIDFLEVRTSFKKTFEKIITNKDVNDQEMTDLSYSILLHISRIVARKKWVLQLHIGALGSVNNLERKRLGKSTGFDAIANQGKLSSSLINFFNELYSCDELPRTIIYDINGNYNELVQSIIGCFQANEESIKCKIQQGPAWWFQDTKSGNLKQLETFSEQSILKNFIGMTTDSRSFLSYVRHDYFRRILCNLVASWIDGNEIDVSNQFLGTFFNAVCYKNAMDYFRIERGNEGNDES